MNIQDLYKPFSPELVSWRVGATNAKKNGGKATKGIALAYIDARDVMARLDDVCGAGNWQCIHPHANGKTSCRIGVKIGDEWVWKENGAGDSEESAEKGAFSDSFKRAAVLWGVGRYLYDVANVWVDLDDFKKIKNPNDPRLVKALSDAAKGIRGLSEPEPEEVIALPLNDAELVDLSKRLTLAKNNNELEDVKTLCRSAWPRMNEAQQKTIKTNIDGAAARLFQAPPTTSQQMEAVQ